MNMNEELKRYYERVDIAPVDKMRTYDEMFSAFSCKKKYDCWAVCKNAWCQDQNQTTLSFLFAPPIKGARFHVSQYYQGRQYEGVRIPRIVVLSLSRPQPKPSEDLCLSDNISQAQSQGSGGGRNQHWSRTLLTVRSLLYPFIGNTDDSPIEKLFVHVRTAKCCSNVGGGSKEEKKVYENCGGFLPGELSILKPDVIVTQGNDAHGRAQEHAFNVDKKVKVSGLDPSIAYIVNLKHDNSSVYWLKMIFPTNRYGHMKKWDEQAGEECDGVRKNLVHYGEKIKEFIDNR